MSRSHVPNLCTLSSFNAGRLLVYDLETSRLEKPGIVQLGVAHFLNGAPERKNVWLLNPGHPIEPDAVKVHGITDEMVKDMPTFSQASHVLFSEMHAGTVLSVSYNGRRFDSPALVEHFDAEGIAWTPPQLDIFDFVQWELRHLKDRKLVDMCARFGVSLSQAHDAGADALAAGQLLFKMVEQKFIPADPREAIEKASKIAPHIDSEFERWSWRLYSREDGKLRIGFGKWCGTPLDEVDPGFCDWLLKKDAENEPAKRMPEEVADIFRRRRRGETNIAIPKDPLLQPPARELVQIGPVSAAERRPFNVDMLPQLPKTAAFLQGFFAQKSTPFSIVELRRDPDGHGKIVVLVPPGYSAEQMQQLSDELWRAFMMSVGLDALGEWARSDKAVHIEVQQYASGIPSDHSIVATIANQPPPSQPSGVPVRVDADPATIHGRGGLLPDDAGRLTDAGLLDKPRPFEPFAIVEAGAAPTWEGLAFKFPNTVAGLQQVMTQYGIYSYELALMERQEDGGGRLLVQVPALDPPRNIYDLAQELHQRIAFLLMNGRATREWREPGALRVEVRQPSQQPGGGYVVCGSGDQRPFAQLGGHPITEIGIAAVAERLKAPPVLDVSPVEIAAAGVVEVRHASGKVLLVMKKDATQADIERAEALALRIGGSPAIESCEVMREPPPEANPPLVVDLQPGAVVRRKGKKERMTIESLNDGMAGCVWFDENGLQRAPFPADSLEPVPAADPRTTGRVLQPRELEPGEMLEAAPLPDGVTVAPPGSPEAAAPLAELQMPQSIGFVHAGVVPTNITDKLTE